MAIAARPHGRGRGRESVCRDKRTAPGAIDADEVGIAESAHGGGSISLLSGPQVAPCEPKKHGRPTDVDAFALECVIDLLERVFHDRGEVEEISDRSDVPIISKQFTPSSSASCTSWNSGSLVSRWIDSFEARFRMSC
jgi:hypothetical protein